MSSDVMKLKRGQSLSESIHVHRWCGHQVSNRTSKYEQSVKGGLKQASWVWRGLAGPKQEPNKYAEFMVDPGHAVHSIGISGASPLRYYIELHIAA